MEEKGRFELPGLLHPYAFQAYAIDRSATSPYVTRGRGGELPPPRFYLFLFVPG
jgi:hypothetical protein